MDLDRDALMPIFLGEADDNVTELEEAILALEATPNDDEVLGRIFRASHTLKGNSESIGFESITRMAHALEGVLDAVRKRALAVTPALVSLMLHAHDALRAMVTAIVDGQEPHAPEHAALIVRLEAASAGAAITAASRVEAPSLGAIVDSEAARKARKTLRVDLATLDRILTFTGELSIARARLQTVLERSSTQIDVADALLESDRLFADLREQVMRLRLVPIGPMFRQQQRAVRDLAEANGKLVRLVLEGQDVEVDSALVDGLRDPIMHMIRNAIDHGIESPAARRAAGKSPVGTITLRALHEAGRILVELRDDGAGFDRAAIVARASGQGMIREGAALTDAEAFELVFAPGFSTAREVTDLSGRGVGMDVVARNVRALKGLISVQSKRGHGAVVAIRVPLTLAIIQGFAVGAGDETYVIPLDSVRECIRLPADERPREGGSGIINLRGEALPYLRLRSLFAHEGVGPAVESVVVVEHEGRRAGLAVDTLRGESQAVVKPLDALLRCSRGIAASTILGDGRVALILDVAAITRDAVESTRSQEGIP